MAFLIRTGLSANKRPTATAPQMHRLMQRHSCILCIPQIWFAIMRRTVFPLKQKRRCFVYCVTRSITLALAGIFTHAPLERCPQNTNSHGATHFSSVLICITRPPRSITLIERIHNRKTNLICFPRVNKLLSRTDCVLIYSFVYASLHLCDASDNYLPSTDNVVYNYSPI